MKSIFCIGKRFLRDIFRIVITKINKNCIYKITYRIIYLPFDEVITIIST